MDVYRRASPPRSTRFARTLSLPIARRQAWTQWDFDGDDLVFPGATDWCVLTTSFHGVRADEIDEIAMAIEARMARADVTS